LITVELEWKVVDNKPAQFVEIKGSERKLPCELALLAMGFVHPQHDGMIGELELELDERGNVRASEKAYQTNIPKIFTAGDMRRGQSLVVWAIKEGRDCAEKVDEFLVGRSLLETADDNSIARYL
jgi:glutamate synthase (NADPH) small chain